MSLSDDERNRLREIETLTLAEDPRFADYLDLDRATRRRRRLRWVCWWLLGVGTGLALVGGATAEGLISMGTMLAALGLALMMWAAVTAQCLRPLRN